MTDRGPWADWTRRRRQQVQLPDASCQRCGPLRVETLPVDQVRLHRGYRGDTRRIFVCPYCRAEVRSPIETTEALRLYAAGVGFDRGQREGQRRKPLNTDELLDFALDVQRAEDLAYRAMHDPGHA